MRQSLRIAAVGGVMAYRALFAWARPSAYIPTVLGFPLFQMVFFVYLGRTGGLRDDAFFVIGNAILGAGNAGLFGMSMAIGGERPVGTLPSLLATPAPRWALFGGRAVPFVVNGLVVSLFLLAAGTLLFGLSLDAGEVAGLAGVMVIAAASCCAFGLLLGAAALRVRDLLLGANLTYLALVLVSGANIPLEDLPGWLEQIARYVPVTNAIEAARGIAGAPGIDVSTALLREVAVMAVYGTVGLLALRVFERTARASGTLELA